MVPCEVPITRRSLYWLFTINHRGEVESVAVKKFISFVTPIKTRIELADDKNKIAKAYGINRPTLYKLLAA